MSDKMALVVNAAYACPNLQGFSAAKYPMRPGTVAAIAFGEGRLHSFSDRQFFAPTVWAGSLPMPEGVNYEYRDKDNLRIDPQSVREHAVFKSRNPENDNIEKDPSWKQVIPYTAVMWNNQLLCYRRPSKNAEARLSGLRSCGFGGHVEPSDFETLLLSYKAGTGGIPATAVVDLAMSREVNEELGINLNEHASYDANFIGWLNHDDTEVGSVHLGLVYLVTVSGSIAFQPQSGEIEGLELLPIDDAYANMAEFEVWSQFVLRHLKATVGK